MAEAEEDSRRVGPAGALGVAASVGVEVARAAARAAGDAHPRRPRDGHRSAHRAPPAGPAGAHRGRRARLARRAARRAGAPRPGGHVLPLRGARAQLRRRQVPHRRGRQGPDGQRRPPRAARGAAHDHAAQRAGGRRRAQPHRRGRGAAAPRRRARPRARARPRRPRAVRSRAPRRGPRARCHRGAGARRRRRARSPARPRGGPRTPRRRGGGHTALVPPEPRPGPRPRVRALHRRWRADPHAAGHEPPLGALGVRHRVGRGAGPPRHGVLRLAAAPRVGAADQRGRGGRGRCPAGVREGLRPGDVLGRGAALRGHGRDLHLGAVPGDHRSRRGRRDAPPPRPALRGRGDAGAAVVARARALRPGRRPGALRDDRGRHRPGQRLGREGRREGPPAPGHRRRRDRALRPRQRTS